MSESAPSSQRVTLQTERLVIREFSERDWERLYAIESDPEAVRYQSYEPRTQEGCRKLIRQCAQDRRVRPRRVYAMAVVLRATDLLIGRCGFRITGDEPGEAVLWYILDRAYWGHGYMPEAARAVVHFGFTTLGLHRFWADVDPRNIASIRLLEELGMRREAHLVENAWIKGEWTDSFYFAILDHEWLRAPDPTVSAHETPWRGDSRLVREPAVEQVVTITG